MHKALHLCIRMCTYRSTFTFARSLITRSLRTKELSSVRRDIVLSWPRPPSYIRHRTQSAVCSMKALSRGSTSNTVPLALSITIFFHIHLSRSCHTYTHSLQPITNPWLKPRALLPCSSLPALKLAKRAHDTVRVTAG